MFLVISLRLVNVYARMNSGFSVSVKVYVLFQRPERQPSFEFFWSK